MTRTKRIALAVAMTGLLFVTDGRAQGEAREDGLTVHLCQANNNSPYAFVRAKFKPGEVTDPWAVRFFDEGGQEVPYFVWDLVTWKVAGEGRADWGNRDALLNHGTGNTPEVLKARGKKLEWARRNLPDLWEELITREKAAESFGDSVCAALYLLRSSVPAYGKEKLTLRVYPEPQVQPARSTMEGLQVEKRTSVEQGNLRFEDLPDRLTVSWKGKELYRYTGFDAGGTSDTRAHVDPSKPFSVEVTEGIITKIHIEGKTKGRKDGQMDWQCTYWLFPEGSYVALEGFNTNNTEGYLGGEQKLSIWEGAAEFKQVHEPLWEVPWWVHQVGQTGFVATHLFYHVPLTIGYGNNPFTVNAEGGNKEPKAEADGKRLALRWFYKLDDPAIFRMFEQRLFHSENLRRWLSGRSQAFLTGKVTDAPEWMDGAAKQLVERQLKYVKWQPKVDWLYRQYAVAVGEGQDDAERALRNIVGAAAGWIDRPVQQQEIASLLVRMMQNQRAEFPRGWDGPQQSLPYLLRSDPGGAREVLRQSTNLARGLDSQIKSMRAHVAHGGNPVEGGTRDENGGIIGEGWIGNPAYYAAQTPSYIRFLEHFDLPHPEEEYREAILRYADFSLEHLGGKPVDFEKLRASFRSHWPNRFVMIIPLMLHAYGLTNDQKYSRAAVMIFEDLMAMAERNPHGYWAAWTFDPKGAALFDSVYNPVAYQRGIVAFWAEGLLDLIGRDKAARLTAAQARYFVFSGQLLDSLEMDNITAIRATDHHGHPNFRNQIAVYLYDDFAFYRGLITELVNWAVASPNVSDEGSSPYRTPGMDYYGSFVLRWAFGIAKGTRWSGATAEQLPDRGFRISVWNGLPWTQPSFWYLSHQLGIEPAHSQAMWLRIKEPTWREVAELEVLKQQDKVRVRVSHRMKLRLNYQLLHPEWTDTEKIALTYRAPDGSTQRLSEGVEQTDEFVEWLAEPGQYVLSNEMLPPLVDLGPGQTYKGEEGGLYPGGSNVRPAAHDAAGRKIARDIVPLDADGNPDPVNGKIVFIPVSVSNAYGAWHRGDEEDTSTTFMTRANANPAKNPKLYIAYGFEYQLPGGNRGTGDPGPDSIFYRILDHALGQQGLTPQQVQIVWLSMPVSGKSWGINLPPEDRTFPADAQQSKLAWKEIVHAIHIRYPNVKIIYSSTKGAMYMSATATENPEWLGGPIEPFNHDAAWGIKWVIEDQINGAPDLNYDPARGPVKAPWLSWGPYFWSYPDGSPRHYDGFVWSRADVAEDGLHPSLSGLTKYANMLLHQMTTDPTATPWFVKPGSPANEPPAIAKAASVAANPVSGTTTTLSVLGADDGGEPNLTYTWSCSGPAGVTFSANGPNRAKNTTATFPDAGRYTFQVTIADAGGLTATSNMVVTVTRR